MHMICTVVKLDFLFSHFTQFLASKTRQLRIADFT